MEKIKAFFKKYAVHILVEIFIIVFGVLIALQVNNWNEERKQDKQLKGILLKVMDDWKSDTAIISIVQKHYEPFIKSYHTVIKKEMTQEFIDTNIYVRGAITSYYPLQIESSGLELLKKFVVSNNMDIDSTISKIVHTNSFFIKTINELSQRVKDNVEINVLAYSDKPWFSDTFLGNSNSGFDAYMKTTEFRNKVLLHKIFVENNLLAFIKTYQQYLISEFPNLEKKYKSL